MLCLHGPRIQNPEAVKKLHLGVLDSTSQPVSWMFGCFAHLMKHWWFWYRNLWLALLRHCLETHWYIHLFLVVVMICFFVHYCVSYYISCSWNLSFAPWGGSRTWKGCLHTPCRSCRSPRFVSFTDYRGSFIHSSVKWRNCLPSAWC